MENNSIICIDSSDDESLPCKIRKCNSEEVLEDAYCVENEQRLQVEDEKITSNCTPDDNLPAISTENDKQTKIKRIELITLEDEDKCMESKDIPEIGRNRGTGDEYDIRNGNSDIEASTSTNNNECEVGMTPEFETFLNSCISCNCERRYKDLIAKKIPQIKCKYFEADEDHMKSDHFKKYIINKTQNVQNKPVNAIIIFNDVYRELESKKKQKLVLTDREKHHLNKLYSAIRKIHRKIKHLENEPVDFEDENNSSFIMLERYKDRFCIIYKKICSYTNENLHSGRHLFSKLDCNASKHSEINHAIDKLYNKNKTFPSYYEIDKCVRKCVKNHNLNLSEDALKTEIGSVFTAVGNVLQRRRRLELYDSLSYFLEDAGEDPAKDDPEFDGILKKRHAETEKKIDDILQKYADFQENGEEVLLSSDSDDSHYLSEDCES